MLTVRNRGQFARHLSKTLTSGVLLGVLSINMKGYFSITLHQTTEQLWLVTAPCTPVIPFSPHASGADSRS